MKSSDFYLHEVAAVILSDETQKHDYSNIHHRFLVSRGVIPSDWEPQDSLISPPHSRIDYENGVQLAVNREVLQISHTRESQFDKNYETYDIAVKYLASMEPIKYNGFGMNWTVVALCHEDSANWIQKHFFRSGIISLDWQSFQARPQIGFVVDGVELGLIFTATQAIAREETTPEAVRIDCVVSHDSLSQKDELIREMSNWQGYEEIVLFHLKSLMGIEQDD